MSIELGAEKWSVLRYIICGISVSQLVAWRKATGGKVVLVPGLLTGSTFLLALILADFFLIHLTSEDEKEETSLVHHSWRTANRCPSDPTAAENSSFFKHTQHFF